MFNEAKLKLVKSIINDKDLNKLFLDRYYDKVVSEKQPLFESAVNNITWRLKHLEDKNDYLFALDIFKKLVIKDISSSIQADMVYNMWEDLRWGTEHFPLYYFNDEGFKIYLLKTETKVNVDLKSANVFVHQWHLNRLINSFKRGEGFEYKADNHKGYFLKHMNVVVITNGNHSIMDGITNREAANIQLDIYDDEPLYDNIVTDGKYWHFKNNTKTEVFDYRIALLFWIQQQIMEKLRNDKR